MQSSSQLNAPSNAALINASQPKSDGSNSNSTTVENCIPSTTGNPRKSRSAPKIRTVRHENVTVTHIESPECFYIQMQRHNKQLYNLSCEISRHIKRFSRLAETPQLDELYLVKYQDKYSGPAWYRARVVDIVMDSSGQEQRYSVHFIDYGNKRVVSRNIVREISTALAKSKPLAHQCKLINLYTIADEWDDKTLKFMAHHIYENKVVMRVFNNCEGILEVDLLTMPHGISIRDALLFFTDTVPYPPNLLSSLIELSLKVYQPLQKRHKATERFSKGQGIDVFISHVVDPHNIYVHIADFKNDITRLNDAMTYYYNNRSLVQKTASKIYIPAKGMPVAVLSDGNSNFTWSRGVITKTYDIQRKVHIFLVDIGKLITVSYTNIAKLEKAFYDFERQAVLVKMVYIEPFDNKNKWNDSAIKFLNKYAIEKQKLGMLIYDPLIIPEVFLFEHCVTADVCINAMMVKENLACATPGLFVQVEWIPNMNTLENVKVLVSDSLEPSSNSLMTDISRFKTEDGSGIGNMPPQPLEKPKSLENNDFYSAINRTIAAPSSAENISLNFSGYSSGSVFPTRTLLISNQKKLIGKDEFIETETESNFKSDMDWLPPTPFDKENFYACVTYVDDHAHIYLHSVEKKHVLQKIEQAMKCIFDSLPVEPQGTIWVPGQICIVKYFVTNSWYRCKIIDVMDEHIKVFMVDYGNVVECKYEDVYRKVLFLDVPAFANKIQLHNVYPKYNEWLMSDINDLRQMVVDEKVYVMLKEYTESNDVNSAVVKLDFISINNWILQKSTNLTYLAIKQPVILDTENVEKQSDDQIKETLEITTSQSISSSFLGSNTDYTWKRLSKTLENQKVPVRVISIISINKFIMEFVDNISDEDKTLFKNISDDIKCRGDQQPVLVDIELGQPCVTRFSGDGKWYRGQVYSLKYITLGEVQIWFVDYGYLEVVPRAAIRVIHPDWLQLPVQQYIGQIFAIELSEKAQLDEVLNHMSRYCNTVKACEIISIEPLLVELYDDNSELCYKDLIEKNALTYKK